MTVATVSPHNAYIELFGDDEEDQEVDEFIPGDHSRLRYRVLTGPDDREFCARVSAALADGYQLWGPPAVSIHDGQVIVAQVVVLPAEDSA